MDHDVYTTDDTIGLVYVDINPLIMRTAHGGTDRDRVIQGWFPLYDTLRGVRGQLHLIVKLQYIGDDNPFRDSSAGVLFFSASTLATSAYMITDVYGFVDELVVENDPEFEWKDNFRMARSSNEFRLSLLYKLTANVRRQLGKKVRTLGGNAVLGHRQHFDIEGDSGIVARAYGTACRVELVKPFSETATFSQMSASAEPDDFPNLLPVVSDPGGNLPKPETIRASTAPAGLGLVQLKPTVYVSSRNDQLGIMRSLNPTQDRVSQEVQLLTLRQFSPNTHLRLGGLVVARAVKFLGKLASTVTDQDTRRLTPTWP